MSNRFNLKLLTAHDKFCLIFNNFLTYSHRDAAFPALLWPSTSKRHFRWWSFPSSCSSHNWIVDIFEKWAFKGRVSPCWWDYWGPFAVSWNRSMVIINHHTISVNTSIKSNSFLCGMLSIRGQKVSTKSLIVAFLDYFPSSSCFIVCEYWNLVPSYTKICVKEIKIWLPFKTWCSLSVPQCATFHKVTVAENLDTCSIVMITCS